MSARVVWVGWLAGVTLTATLARGDGGAYSRALALSRGLGWLALSCLALALCVTPLARLLQRLGRSLPRAAALRRALGLAAVSGALLHGMCSVWQSPLELREQYAEPALQWGMGALLSLCALGVTSFGSVLRRLRLSTWKELHRLAYVAFVCAVLHALYMPFAWTLGVLGVCAWVLGFGALRLISIRGPAADP